MRNSSTQQSGAMPHGTGGGARASFAGAAVGGGGVTLTAQVGCGSSRRAGTESVLGCLSRRRRRLGDRLCSDSGGGRGCLVRGGAGRCWRERRRGTRITQYGVGIIARDGICPQRRQGRLASWLAGAGVEDNNYLPRTPAEGREREGLDGRPTQGDDG
jgi:hypothetical protein